MFLKRNWRAKAPRSTRLTYIGGAFAYSAGLRVHHNHNAQHPCPCMAFHLFSLMKKKKGEKRICGCHWASCGRFPLGWHAAVVFCHRASGDIMWAYQVAARVSGGMWVTQCLVSSEPQRFLPSLCPLSAGGAARVRGISRPTLSGGELVRPRREQSLQTLKKKKRKKKNHVH